MKLLLVRCYSYMKSFFLIVGGIIVLSSPLVSSAEFSGNFKSTGGTSIKVYILNCGHIEARDMSVFNPAIGKGEVGELANPCYLIKHPKGSLLWDAGVSDELVGKPDGIEVSGGAFKFTVTRTLAEQLDEINITASNIDYLAFSHMHIDHTGNAKLFLDATWLVQKSERGAAYSEHAEKYGYHPEDYKEISESVIIREIQGDYDVFGDGSVVIISTPGHSAGHQSLFLDLPNYGAVVLSGGLYHFQANRDNYGIPVWNSKKETIRSFAKVDEILDATKGELWIHHDKNQFDSQNHSPKFYD